MSILGSDLHYRGPRGYSNYEIAVQEGYTGTAEEWLEEQKQGAFDNYKADFDAEYIKNVTEYDEHCTEKTKEYNDNCTTKTTEYNNNCTEKVAEATQTINELIAQATQKSSEIEPYAEIIQARGTYSLLNERLDTLATKQEVSDINLLAGGTIEGDLSVTQKITANNIETTQELTAGTVKSDNVTDSNGNLYMNKKDIYVWEGTLTLDPPDEGMSYSNNKITLNMSTISELSEWNSTNVIVLACNISTNANVCLLGTSIESTQNMLHSTLPHCMYVNGKSVSLQVDSPFTDTKTCTFKVVLMKI